MGYLNKGLPPPRVQPNAAGPAEGGSSPVPGSGSFKGGGSFRSTGGSFRKARLALSFASDGAEKSERTTAESSESPVSTRRLGRQSTKKLGGEEGDEPQAPKRRGSIATARLMATARRGSVAPGRRSSVASLKRGSIASAADDDGSGSLTLEELRAAMRAQTELSDSEIDELFIASDRNQDGSLTLMEAMRGFKSLQKEGKLTVLAEPVPASATDLARATCSSAAASSLSQPKPPPPAAAPPVSRRRRRIDDD